MKRAAFNLSHHRIDTVQGIRRGTLANVLRWRVRIQYVRKINWSFWCVRERPREARAGRRGGQRRRRAEAAALRAPAPALRSAARRALELPRPRPRPGPRRKASRRRPRYVNRRWRVGVGRQRVRHCAAARACEPLAGALGCACPAGFVFCRAGCDVTRLV